jgi:hypothetical protein
MRRNVVLILVLLGFVVIAGLVLIQPKQTVTQSPLSRKPSESTSITASNTMPAHATSSASATLSGTDPDLEPANQPGMSAADPRTNGSAVESAETRHEAYVDARTAELMDLGMNDDSESLNTILSELNNRDPQIRKAAVEAAVQFGSRDAIPNLMDAAAQTDDPQEKAEIMEAIQFLKLPTLSEAAAQANQAQHPGMSSNVPGAGLRR